MKKLVVMDYSNCSINVYDVTDIKNQDIDNYIDEHGHNLDECNYMLSDSVTINRFDLNNK